MRLDLPNKFRYDAPPGLDQRVEDGAGIAFGEGGGNRVEEAEEDGEDEQATPLGHCGASS